MTWSFPQRARQWQAALAPVLVGVALLALLPPAQAYSQPIDDSRDARSAFRALERRASTPIDIHWNAYGTAEFLAAEGDGRLPFTPARAERDDPVAAARGFLEQNRALFGIQSAAEELKLLRTEPDTQLGWAHVRFDQVYKGLPVYGKQLVVHLDQQQRPVAVNGQFVPGLDVPTEPLVTATEAADVALKNLRDVQLDVAERLGVEARVLSEKTTLVVHVDQAGKARPAWLITVMTEKPLGQWRFFVYARRPMVIHAFDSLNNAKRRVTYSANNTTRLPGRKLIDEGERSRDDIAQAAHDGAGVVYDYYFKNFKRDSIDGKGMAIVSTVHYGSAAEDAENAAWIGELQQMIYGDGGQIFRPLAYGLDVVAHELTHGVTDNTAQLIYEGQSGALNESYSDVFGALIDSANWTIGEQVVKSPPFPTPVMRSLEDPTLGGYYDPDNPLQGVGQPATADQYANLPLNRQYDNGGVHINSGIPNHAAFFVAQALGRDKTAQIYYRTLTQYLTPDSDFFDAANASVRAAQDIYDQAEADAVRNAFTQVGIDASGAETQPPPPATDDPLPDIPPQPDQDQPLPQGCTDIITNGGFETDDGWVQASAGEFSLIDPELPHSGRRSAWLGGTDQEPVQLLYQEVRIPPNATTVQLSYYRLVHEEFTGLSGIFARESTFSVLFAKSNGDVIGAVEQVASSEADDTWNQVQFDVSELAGKTVRLAFSAENTRGNVSSFFVDDVVLAACTAGGNGGPSTPKPQNANNVFIEGTLQNADTGRGVNGAQVFIIKPDRSASQAAEDGVVTEDEVITYGVSDASGFYRTNAAVPKGATYGVIILAGGFRPIVADDGITIEANAPNPVTVDATLRRGR